MPSEPFTDLASVYDAIMSDIEYDDWIAFILRTVIERGWKGGRILDLGCGTGNSTSPIFSRGFEVQGVDASAAMLAVAQEKLPQVRLFQADFETFELPDRFTLVYSVFDSLNNLLAAGLNIDAAHQAVSGGAAGSWVLTNRAANMIADRYPLGFRTRLHRKDLGIALETARELGVVLPVAAFVEQIETGLMKRGHGEEDVSNIARFFREQAGL